MAEGSSVGQGYQERIPELLWVKQTSPTSTPTLWSSLLYLLLHSAHSVCRGADQVKPSLLADMSEEVSSFPPSCEHCCDQYASFLATSIRAAFNGMWPELRESFEFLWDEHMLLSALVSVRGPTHR